AFSPVDINCRRSDPESFLDQVLDGIRQSAAAGARVTVKLHPADEAEHYREVLAAHSGLSVELVSSGDVAAMFGAADVYVTGPSTSLLEAVAAGTPIIFYQVNSQKLHPPYRDDPFIAARTASSPGDLADALGRELAPTGEGEMSE